MKVLVNSLPKSGTNLVASVLAELPFLEFQKITLNRNLRRHPLNLVPFGATCPVGVDQPHQVKVVVLRSSIRRLRDARYTAGHLPHSSPAEQVLAEHGVRTITIVRDPRDVVVSQMFHVVRHSSHFLHRYYVRLPSDRHRLLAAIEGVRALEVCSLGIREKLDIMKGWREARGNLVLRFEDLVGEAGGGDAERQLRATSAMAQHIGLPVEAGQVAEAAGRAFGTGGTFRQGQIGGWRQHFDEEVREAFKTEVGGALVELGYETTLSW